MTHPGDEWDRAVARGRQIEREFAAHVDGLTGRSAPGPDAPASDWAASARQSEAMLRGRAEMYETYLNTVPGLPNIVRWALQEAAESDRERSRAAGERAEHFESQTGAEGDR